jgi:predicted 3-demethylubiquinone-9 3-methyltransferase (glyoxalase superfamily)
MSTNKTLKKTAEIEQKITPNLWFADKAEEAAEFYVSIFDNATLGTINRYGAASAEVAERPAGSVLTVDFELDGQEFTALNGGPAFTFNPGISFIVNCSAENEVNELWEQLSVGGEVLMPLDAYPFSDRYGWIQDRYGISWQLILADPDGEWRPKFTPSMMFVGDNCGNAEAAMDFYTTIFSDTTIGQVARYGPDQDPDEEGTIMYADFKLEGEWLAAMDSAQAHDFSFNEAISFIVHCEDQVEVDEYWEKLSAVPEAEQCGWLKDKYGVSWQIVPTRLYELLQSGDADQSRRVAEAMLQMEKIDIEALEQAAESTEKKN